MHAEITEKVAMERGRPPLVRGRRGRGRPTTGAALPFSRPAPDPAQAAEELPSLPPPYRRPMEPPGARAESAALASAPAPSPQSPAPHLAQPISASELQLMVRTTVIDVLREQAEVQRPVRLTSAEYMD